MGFLEYTNGPPAPKRPKAPKPAKAPSKGLFSSSKPASGTGSAGASASYSPSAKYSSNTKPVSKPVSSAPTMTTRPIRYSPPVETSRPEPIELDRQSLLKKVQARISRRGGYGIYNPMIPVPTTRDDIVGDFGPRIHPSHGGHSFHTGADMSQPAGTPVLASNGGVVSKAAQDNIYGNQVVLDHGANEQTMYGHMTNYTVQPGEKVKKGQVIGYVGSTGLSTGNHLHWETWKDGVEMDPGTIFERDIPESIINEALKKAGARKTPQGASSQPPSPAPATPVASGGELGSRERWKNNAYKVVASGGETSSRERYKNNNQEVEVEKIPTAEAANYAVLPPSGPTEKPKSQNMNGPTNEFQAFLNAISQQESGDNYEAVGIPTRYGTALGKYQILDANISGEMGWDMEALGRDISAEEFLNTPAIQDKVAKFKLKEYFDTYGPGGAAKAWYAGPGNATLDSNTPQPGGMPSVNSYEDQVLGIMQKYLQGG